jgi:O-antigen ligase
VQAILLLVLLIFSLGTACEIVSEDYRIFLNISILILSAAVIISLVGMAVLPQNFSKIESGALRMHGVYGEPSNLALASGLNIGLVYFLVRSKLVKTALIFLSLFCIYFSGVRTAVLALGGSFLGLLILQSYIRLHLKAIVVGAFIALCTIYILFSEVVIESEISFLRSSTIGTLSGRTEVWKKAVPVALKKPFGSGYCMGGAVLFDNEGRKLHFNSVERNFKLFEYSSVRYYKTSLHNGFVQALSDIGFIGVIFYLCIFLIGLFCVYRNRGVRDLAPYGFVFLFLTLANLTESVIMSPTTKYALFFWISWFVNVVSLQPKVQEIPAAEI